MALFEIHLEIVSDSEWDIEDLKEALGEFCSEHELNLQGTVVKEVMGNEVERDYIVI